MMLLAVLSCDEGNWHHGPLPPPVMRDAGCTCDDECRHQRCRQLGRVAVQLSDADAGFPAGIAVGASEVYWLINDLQQNGGLIMAAPLTGGPARVLASEQPLPSAMTMAPDGLWWANDGVAPPAMNGVWHDPLDGGGPRWIASIGTGARAVTAASEWVFFTHGDGVWRVPKLLDRVPEQVADGPVAWQLAGDATHVYWWGAQDALRRMAVAGGPVEVIARGENPRPLFVRDGTVYWSEIAVPDRGDGEVKAVASDGGEVRVIASGVPTSFSLEADATHVYWVGAGTYAGSYVNGFIGRCPKAGCGACLADLEVLACGQGRAFNLTLDATRVYWATWTGIWATQK